MPAGWKARLTSASLGDPDEGLALAVQLDNDRYIIYLTEMPTWSSAPSTIRLLRKDRRRVRHQEAEGVLRRLDLFEWFPAVWEGAYDEDEYLKLAAGEIVGGFHCGCENQQASDEWYLLAHRRQLPTGYHPVLTFFRPPNAFLPGSAAASVASPGTGPTAGSPLFPSEREKGETECLPRS